MSNEEINSVGKGQSKSANPPKKPRAKKEADSPTIPISKRYVGQGKPLPLGDDDPFVPNEFGVIEPQRSASLTINGVPLIFVPEGTTAPVQPEAANDARDIQGAKNTRKGVETDRSEKIEPSQPEASSKMDTSSQTTAQTPQDTSNSGQGDVSPSGAVAESLEGFSVNLTREPQAAATRRWRSTGIAEQVAVYRDAKREEYTRANPGSKRRDAHEYAWECALAAFPPPGVEPQAAEPLPSPPAAVEVLEDPAAEVAPQPIPSDQGVPGLGTLPDSWGTLPANASLQVEIAWVAANRLLVRDGHGVDLSRALSPAPSYSALSWLETSILFPSKFADISVKATQNQEDEAQHIRREKLAIEEVRALLAEMMEDDPPKSL